MTTLAFFGDRHIHPTSPRYAHALEVWDDAIQCAREEHHVSAFVGLGDVCEGALSGAALFELGRRYEAMARYDTPVIEVLGNHEDLDALAPLRLIRDVSVADTIVHVKAFPDVIVAALPYPRRGRPPYGRDETTSIADSMRQAAGAIETDIRRARALADSMKRPLIVAGHWTVEGMTVGPSDYELHAAHEVIVPSAVAEIADLTVVGHIHKPQAVGPQIVGAGSMYRTSFGEVTDTLPRSWVLAHVGRGGVDWERVPTKARPMVVLEGDLTTWTAEHVAEIAPRLAGVEVKIIMNIPENRRASVPESLVLLPIQQTAALLSVEKRIVARQRVRAPEVTPAMGLAQQLDQWFRAIGDAPEDERQWQRLTDKAARLEEGAP